MHELGTNAADGASPAQTAAMEAMWHLGLLGEEAAAPAAAPGLQEVRLQNRFEVFAEEAESDVPAPPAPWGSEGQATACDHQSDGACCSGPSSQGFTNPRWVQRRGRQRAKRAG